MALAEFKRQHNRVHYRFSIEGDQWNVTRFHLYEAVNTPGFLNVSLIHPNSGVDLDSMIGKKATFSMIMGTGDGFPDRKYHGVIREFHLTGTDVSSAYYEATVVPRLWQLSLTHRSRIHVTDKSQGISVKEKIKDLLKDHGLDGDSNVQLAKSYPQYSFLTQYDENDLDFMHRLIEEYGIGYYIEHAEGNEFNVFFDSNDQLPKCSPFDEVLVRRSSGSLMDDHESIEEMTLRRSMTYGFADTRGYDFKDSLRRKQSFKMSSNPAPAEADNEYYGFPHQFEDQESSADQMSRQTDLRLEEFTCGSILASGWGNYRSMAPGHKFKTKNLNNEGMSKEWICLSVHHTGEEQEHVDTDPAPMAAGGVGYQMHFTCIPATVTYRPPRATPKPKVCGSQTAVVVGESGQEIDTDQYGRIKVHMHWDRQAALDTSEGSSPVDHDYDDKSSFWVRVSQVAAGRGWGIFSLPRIGQEVVVSYIDGNPDQPIVTGVVHNDYQRTPYKLPDHKTRTLIKTNSTPGGQGFNEIRIEDKKGKEQIFIHAERNEDVRVKANCMETIGGSRHLFVGDVQREKIMKDKHIQIGGEQLEVIDKDFKIQVKGFHELTVGENRDTKIVGDDAIRIGGQYWRQSGRNEIVRVGGDLLEQVKGDWNISVGKGVGVMASQKIVVQSSQSICLTGPGGFVKIDASGVTIQGTMVKINSGGSPDKATQVLNADLPEFDPPEPKDPTPADNDVSGEKSLLPSPPA